jgi:hypothetical protein
MATPKTTLEQILELDEAITKTLAALQTAGAGGDSLMRNRYADLQAARKDLMDQYNKEQGSSGPAFNVGLVRGY